MTVAEFKSSPDYAAFVADWKSNHEGQEPTDADIKDWIEHNKNN